MDSCPLLTPCQVEILKLSKEHNNVSSKFLARLLVKSSNTIDKQWEQILERLEVTNRYAAVRKAEELGII